jgi:5-hydroxyisourate hydrolase
MGKLTTHVLDTAHGRPGAGIALSLYRCDGHGGRAELARRLTNADGRCDAPLLTDDAMQAGTYEIDFAVGDYFAALGTALPTPRFLDVVTLRFGIADPAAHYHVPLLVSPYGYSTYRGS